jgi:hypothetical protein
MKNKMTMFIYLFVTLILISCGAGGSDSPGTTDSLVSNIPGDVSPIEDDGSDGTTAQATDSSSKPDDIQSVTDATNTTYVVDIRFDNRDGSSTILYNVDNKNEGTRLLNGLLRDALQFDGYSSYLLLPDSDALDLDSQGTIEVLIYAYTHEPFAGLVHKGVARDFSDEAYSLQFWNKKGHPAIVLRNDYDVMAKLTSKQELLTNEWHHIVATWDQDEISLYINGIKDGSMINTIGNVRTSDGGLVIGAKLPDMFNKHYGNIGFNGLIEQVKIFTQRLNDDTIKENYDAIQSQIIQ